MKVIAIGQSFKEMCVEKFWGSKLKNVIRELPNG